MARILIVEDQEDLAGVLQENLEAEGHAARIAGDAAAALELAGRWRPELVVLDLILPDRPGSEVLRTLRGTGFVGPVLVLSARGDERTKVRELRGGADDYITKPFGLLELLARVENLLRRIPRAQLPELVELGDRVRIHTRARRVVVEGREVELRPMEMDLLLALLRRADEAVSRRTLLAEVWGYSPRAETRTVDWHVASLRGKLGEDAQEPRFLKTVRSVGYRLDVEER